MASVLSEEEAIPHSDGKKTVELLSLPRPLYILNTLKDCHHFDIAL